jgi:serine protease inhibitor
MMCSKFTSNKGNVLLGFEHLTHEIWVDNNQLLNPKYFNRQEKKFTTAYDNLDFENTPNFVKIAVIVILLR